MDNNSFLTVMKILWCLQGFIQVGGGGGGGGRTSKYVSSSCTAIHHSAYCY